MPINESLFSGSNGLTNSSWIDVFFPVLQKVIAVSYATIFVLGTSGNVATCYIMFCCLKRSATSVFLINLCLADLMMALFCVPITLISDCLILHWIFGSVMCRVFPFIQGLSVFLSALTHVVISIDRYFVVFHPLRRQNLPMQGALVAIVVVWVLSVLGSVPMVFVSQLLEKGHAHFCREMWQNEKHGVIYSLVVLVMQYFLPLVVIITSYTVISIFMWTHRPPGESMRQRDEAIVTSKRRMIKMLILLAVFYCLSQLPRHVIFLTSINVSENVSWNPSDMLIMNLAHLLSLSACFYNPLLYIWLNTTFRRKFTNLFICRKPMSTQQSNPDRVCTFQDNPALARRRLSISGNNMILSAKLSERRGP